MGYGLFQRYKLSWHWWLPKWLIALPYSYIRLPYVRWPTVIIVTVIIFTAVMLYSFMYIRHCVVKFNAARRCFQSGKCLHTQVCCVCVFRQSDSALKGEQLIITSVCLERCMNSKELSWNSSGQVLKAAGISTVHCRPVNHMTQCIFVINVWMQCFKNSCIHGIMVFWLDFLLINECGR